MDAIASVKLLNIDDTKLADLDIFGKVSGQRPDQTLQPDIVPLKTETTTMDIETVAEANPAPPRTCLLCGTLGTEDVCGPLRSAQLEGNDEVHHLCALWAPRVYQPENSSTYVNIQSEYQRSLRTRCVTCQQLGAVISCSAPGCRSAYHLPCALATHGLFMDSECFEVLCPKHADGDAGASDAHDPGDEDFVLSIRGNGGKHRPKRITGTPRRQRMNSDSQRSRTDWQQQDENTWVKIVPPWWSDHKTVHFATRVHRDLFRCLPIVCIIDPDGVEHDCEILTENRNDMRQQFTLRGAFHDIWDAQHVAAGDVLIFKREPSTGKIRLQVNKGAAIVARTVQSKSPSIVREELLPTPPRQRIPRERYFNEDFSSSTPLGASGKVLSHPNRWAEGEDGWVVKTVYKSTLAHQQCPIAGWLFRRLYDRAPGMSDSAPIYDPDLQKEYCFDVTFIPAANVHYITGRSFSAWIRDSGLQAGEQLRIKRGNGSVLLQRVPTNSILLPIGMFPSTSADLVMSPPSIAALEALEALAAAANAAAGYASLHGTPRVQALVGQPGGVPACGTGTKRESTLDHEMPSTSTPEQKRPRTSNPDASNFADIMRVLSTVHWADDEMKTVVRFRAKYCCLDSAGRQVAHMNVMELKEDKNALFEVLKGTVGQG